MRVGCDRSLSRRRWNLRRVLGKEGEARDIAAGSAIVLAAGGRVTDYEGQPVDVTAGNVVATNGKIHDILLAELARAVVR